jgi:hypothetical protein
MLLCYGRLSQRWETLLPGVTKLACSNIYGWNRTLDLGMMSVLPQRSDPQLLVLSFRYLFLIGRMNKHDGYQI